MLTSDSSLRFQGRSGYGDEPRGSIMESRLTIVRSLGSLSAAQTGDTQHQIGVKPRDKSSSCLTLASGSTVLYLALFSRSGQ